MSLGARRLHSVKRRLTVGVWHRRPTISAKASRESSWCATPEYLSDGAATPFTLSS